MRHDHRDIPKPGGLLMAYAARSRRTTAALAALSLGLLALTACNGDSE